MEKSVAGAHRGRLVEKRSRGLIVVMRVIGFVVGGDVTRGGVPGAQRVDGTEHEEN